MKKVELMMDEKRNLFVKDNKGTVYNFWPMGWGIPVSFIVETEEEAEAKRQREKENQIKELQEHQERQEQKQRKRWFN